MKRVAALSWLVFAAACGDDAATTGDASGSGGEASTSRASSSGAGGEAAEGSGAGAGAGQSASSTTSSGAGAGGGAGTGGAGGDAPVDSGPELYPGDRVHSPITVHVAERLREILGASEGAPSDVFMKVGASSTVSPNTLFCFDGGAVDLGEHAELEGTLAYFLAGDAAGTSPFARESLAAEVGRGASWAISGDPSPLSSETAAIDPRIALVHYGTNDMGGGATFESALVAFHANLSALVEELEAAGIVPVLFGITRRGDDDDAQRWVAAFNAAIRGVAQRLQTPHVDLFAAIDPLEGNGLGGDGLHLEAYQGGACVLDDAGLEHGYNVRNLVALEALDRVQRVAFEAEPAFDEPGPALVGDGSAASPWTVAGMPFSHSSDTAFGAREIDGYPACASEADESGPELWYRLDLDTPRRVRALVLDREGVDVDLHLVGASADECFARGHHLVEASLDAGTYHLVVDSWVDDEAIEHAGAYTLVVVECDDDDETCGGG